MPSAENTLGIREKIMHSNVLILRKYLCPVCGFYLDYPPKDFNICPSCGVEFDADTIEYSDEELRQAWMARGMTWSSSVIPRPASYNPVAQLQNLTGVSIVVDSSMSRGELGNDPSSRIRPMSSTTAGSLRLQRA
jgi:hypothetical protein